MLTITIGICTFNDSRTIGPLLRACTSIAKRINIEGELQLDSIIVVSSGSTDGTNDRIMTIAKRETIVRPIIQMARLGKSHAINTILTANRSDSIIFIPADVQVTYQSIILLIRRLYRDDRIGAACGFPIPALSNDMPRSLYFMLTAIWKLHNCTLQQLAEKHHNAHLSGELLIIRASAFDRLPTEIINDDAYMAIAVKQRGYRIGFEPKAKVLIEVPHTLSDYIIQRKRILRGHEQLLQLQKTAPTNFKYLWRRKPLLAVIIACRAINSPTTMLGLLFATVVELMIELETRLTHKAITFRYPLWKRIQTYAADAAD